jgi:hypothetical protein
MTIFGTFLWAFDTHVSLSSPPPDMEPTDGWFSSPEGLEAATFSLRAARLLQGVLDIGYDVNSDRLLSWYHTRIDRMTRIIFLHLRNAKSTDLPTIELFQNGMVSCLRWFYGLGHQERFHEWIDRLNSATSPKSDEEEAAEASTFFARMVISAQDKTLARFFGTNGYGRRRYTDVVVNFLVLIDCSWTLFGFGRRYLRSLVRLFILTMDVGSLEGRNISSRR